MCFALKVYCKVDLLKEKVAVATVKGKAYFFVVNQLREKRIPFISLVPGEPVPSEVKVVVTTERESRLIRHEKVLIFNDENELDTLVNEVKRILLGKEAYEKITVGVDTGMAIGLAMIADGQVIEEANCFSTPELVNKVLLFIKDINFSATDVNVKIGNGVPLYREITESLDDALPPQVTLEIVGEAGTTRPLQGNKRSRKVRHISSAKRIAARTGYVVPRRKAIAANSRI